MKKAHFYTFGCKVNQYDTQSVKEKILAAGFAETSSAAEADVIVINSCTVTAEADRQCRQVARRILRAAPQAEVIIFGCYSRRAREELAAVFSSEKRLRLASSAEELAGILGISFPPPAAGNASDGIRNFSEMSRAYVKIQDGCDQFCSYCVVPLVRNTVVSRRAAEILAEVGRLVENGYFEIVLCGVRLGRYRASPDYSLEELVSDLLALRDDFRIRLSSIEINEITPRFLGIMKKNPSRVCWHLHIPLQSGSDGILAKMNRPYTAAAYEKRIGEIRAGLPGVTLTTDIIIGFPGETETDFWRTAALAEKIGFAKLHIFPYSARPGTAAAAMPQTRDADYLKALATRKKKLFALDERLQKTARAASEKKPHLAIAIGDGWALAEDYQYYKIPSPAPRGIFKLAVSAVAARAD